MPFACWVSSIRPLHVSSFPLLILTLAQNPPLTPYGPNTVTCSLYCIAHYHSLTTTTTAPQKRICSNTAIMDSSMVWFHVTDRNFNPLDEGTPLQVKVFNKTLCSEFIDFARTQQPDLKDVFPQHIVVWKLVVPIPLSQKNDVEDVYDEMRVGGDTNGMDIDLPAKKLEHWDNMIPPDENEISSSDPWPEKHLHLLVQITREGLFCFALIITEYTHIMHMQIKWSKVVSYDPTAAVSLSSDATVGDPDEKRAISGVSRVLRAHGLTLVDPSYLTVHVRTFGSWSEEDLRDSLNNIKLVDGLDDFRIAKKTLKDAEADLDRVRTLSDVRQSAFLILSSKLTVPAILTVRFDRDRCE